MNCSTISWLACWSIGKKNRRDQGCPRCLGPSDEPLFWSDTWTWQEWMLENRTSLSGDEEVRSILINACGCTYHDDNFLVRMGSPWRTISASTARFRCNRPADLTLICNNWGTTNDEKCHTWKHDYWSLLGERSYVAVYGHQNCKMSDPRGKNVETILTLSYIALCLMFQDQELAGWRIAISDWPHNCGFRLFDRLLGQQICSQEICQQTLIST